MNKINKCLEIENNRRLKHLKPYLLTNIDNTMMPEEFRSGKYLIVRVDGHSMDDGSSMSIPDGTEILIRELNFTPWQMLPIRNNLFIIVSKERAVLKQIIEHNTELGYIRCRSYNPKFKDYCVSFEDIKQLFIFEKVVSYRPPIPEIK